MIDDSDMDMLRKRVEKQETQYVKLLIEQTKYFSRENDDEDAEEKLPLPEAVYIILFLPETPEQHVHTIEFPKGSGTNILLAFEDENECKSFADMLVRDMGFEDPCVRLHAVCWLYELICTHFIFYLFCSLKKLPLNH